jgi:hypothetical protein
MNVRRFFLDESGHTGDLVRPRGALAFAGQPIFALACIGVGDEMALLAELDRLRRVHRVGSSELKSKLLKGKLPRLGGDLSRFLIAQDWPIFVEIVEKRFFVAIHVVNHLLCGRISVAQVDFPSRNLMAEFISDRATEPVLETYVAACATPTIEKVRAALDALLTWIGTEEDETARLVQIMALHARHRTGQADADAAAFLPLADVGPGGKPIWMLPNLQCLTNIYARMNQCVGDGLAGAELVHDEQMQYCQVLHDAKSLMETLAAEASIPIMPFADYRLRGTARLSFAGSTVEPCIQAADILAGFAMRFVKDALERPSHGDPATRSAFSDLLGASDPFRATGINLVMTGRDLELAGIATYQALIC